MAADPSAAAVSVPTPGSAEPVGCARRKAGSLGIHMGHADPLPWKGRVMQAHPCAGWSLPPSLCCHGSPWSVVAQETPPSCSAAKGQDGGNPPTRCLPSPAACSGGWAPPHPDPHSLPSLAAPAPRIAPASALLHPCPGCPIHAGNPLPPHRDLPRSFPAMPSAAPPPRRLGEVVAVAIFPWLMCFNRAVRAPWLSPTPAWGTLRLPEHRCWCATGSPDPATERSKPWCTALQPCNIPSAERAAALA